MRLHFQQGNRPRMSRSSFECSRHWVSFLLHSLSMSQLSLVHRLYIIHRYLYWRLFGHCLFFKKTRTGSPAGKIRHMVCRRWLGACNCKASALALLASKTRPSELRSCHSLWKSTHTDMEMHDVAWVYPPHVIFGYFLCFLVKHCYLGQRYTQDIASIILNLMSSRRHHMIMNAGEILDIIGLVEKQKVESKIK